MIPWIVDASYIEEYRIHVTFNDGVTGEIDFAGEFDGEIFEPLKEVAYFQQFRIEGHTLAWENGADFAPEYLRNLVSPEASVTP